MNKSPLSQFDPLYSDIRLCQESLFVLSKLTDLAAKNPDHPLSRNIDEFLEANVRAHHVATVINLHKVYDDATSHSLSNLLRWTHDNIEEFSRSKLTERLLSSGFSHANIQQHLGSYDGIESDFRWLANHKKGLQGLYDKDVRTVRNEVFAHRSLTPASNQVFINILVRLANGAMGIYKDIWHAYINGLKISCFEKDFQDNQGLGKSIEKYFDLYAST